MPSWKDQYNKENLQDACEVAGIAPSQLDFVEIKKVPLSDIKLMWHGDSVLSREDKERGWAEGLSLDETQKQLQELYSRRFLNTVENLDPIIVIDGALFDGWGRCSLAHAVGESVVMAAVFATKKNRKESIYLTEPNNFEIAKNTLKFMGSDVEYEDFNKGLLIFFNSKEDKEKAVASLRVLIDDSLEGNWFY